jgi:predicted Rossmann fold flavoprotein
MAAIWAARTRPHLRVMAVDGARAIGAKILVAGGGRCNVTHHEVDETAFAGSSRNAIRQVLRRYDVEQTVKFFKQLGVELKREETGKLFPTTDRAKTVLNALMKAADDARVSIRFPRRVEKIERIGDEFLVSGPWGEIATSKVILATGGKSLPKSGSDGGGYTLAQSLGHSLTPRIFPALVPLNLPDGHFIRELSGLTFPATLTVRDRAGRKLAAFTNSTLCTHFGLSGPSVLDISRYLLDAKQDDPGAGLFLNWLPEETFETFDAQLRDLGKITPLGFLKTRMPERLARALVDYAKIPDGTHAHRLPRDLRVALARAVTELPVPVTGNRGFAVAEVTAGGVPLKEIDIKHMESRIVPGLYFCGEICDVDGRIGGFNFQWAWSSGYIAGVSAVTAGETAR